MSEFTYNKKQFLLDGKPFTIISGAIHYFRVVPEYWEDRLKKLRACGFNTVETYVAWNLHERKEGKFDFSGRLDIVRFIEIANSLGLKVILRPGPYICAEFEGGGLPSWLLTYPKIKIRCNDPNYLKKVRPYYRELFTRVSPHLCTKGGPIIMVQIENEYGSYGNDHAYMRAIANIYKEYGLDCLLFTADGSCDYMIEGGTLPEYPAVMNFGSNPKEAFDALDRLHPGQPYMCGEFWCGWFDHWGEEHHVRTPEETVSDLREMLEMGASFNFYMFHGGTNFGFTNGANHGERPGGGGYAPTVTSYDYSAPLSESGDMTPTFFAVRDEIARFTGVTPPLDVSDSRKIAYGRVRLNESVGLFETLSSIGKTFSSPMPLTMEEARQDFGYILYTTEIRGSLSPRSLIFPQLHDRAHVFIDGKLVGIRDRLGALCEIQIGSTYDTPHRIDILVENLGRVNYGAKTFDKKGIVGGVRLGQTFHFGWRTTTLPMDDLSALSYKSVTAFDGRPRFYRGNLRIDGTPADTFIAPVGFHKGFIVVNGFNLGRYWNDKGPQKTLYVPAPILKKGNNEIVVFETDGVDKPEVKFLSEPILG
jgi:beta-galactosidase